jgi:DNA-binding transcriptional MerR regulator
VLEHKHEGDWQRLQVWPRSEVNQTLATNIDATVTELANELGAYVTARCAWFDSDKQTYWTEHALRVQPEDMEGFQAFSGDNTSQAIQMQRHQERVLGMGLSNINSAMQCLRESNQLVGEQARQAQSENLRLRERVAELEQENARLSGMLEQALAAAENAEAQAGDSSHEKQVLQLVTTALGGQLAARKTS